MKYEVISTKVFLKDTKVLLKKYPSLKKELINLLSSLSIKPTQGESIGHNCYKIRIAIPEKNKGKSGGARMIHLVLFYEKKIFPLTIYDKSEKESLSKNELIALITYIKSNKHK